MQCRVDRSNDTGITCLAFFTCLMSSRSMTLRTGYRPFSFFFIGKKTGLYITHGISRIRSFLFFLLVLLLGGVAYIPSRLFRS
ncbi:hypothetical protein F5B21DRAFT_474899 [Xylaria acuta]|nr:hypothetical protein F5B21DRAFT_474899 [Xylaria acuta]